jgi:hypothetical protein
VSHASSPCLALLRAGGTRPWTAQGPSPWRDGVGWAVSTRDPLTRMFAAWQGGLVNRSHLLGRLLLCVVLCAGGPALAQNELSRLSEWVGKYPAYRDGKTKKDFFALPVVRRSLGKLLDGNEMKLLTREYSTQSPIGKTGDFLTVGVCRPHFCPYDDAALAINLKSGLVYVRMTAKADRRFRSDGKVADLPTEIQAFLQGSGPPLVPGRPAGGSNSGGGGK